MLGPLPQRVVQQFDHDGAQHKADEESLYFVPYPRADSLRRKLVPALQAEAVIVEADPQSLADDKQQQQVHKKRQRIVLKSQAVRQIAQPA